MSKKKLRLTIIILTLCLFAITTLANYNSACITTSNSFQKIHERASTVKEILEHYYLTEENLAQLNTEEINLAEYISLKALDYTYINFPYTVVITDMEFNILAKSASSVYVVPHYNGTSEKNAIIIKLDKYITKDIHKQLKKSGIYGTSVTRVLPDVKYFSFVKEADEYIPVKLCFEGYENDPVIFSDKDSTVTFTGKTDLINLNIHGLEAILYEENYYEDIDKYLDDAFNNRASGGSTMLRTSTWIEAGEEIYIMWISAKYSPFIRAVTSSQFLSLTLLTAILFVVTGVLVMIISQSFLKKGQQLEKSKRTFISAAAHELKTPLAVIQNQCECILEDVVPEKKDEYIKSVYDEAVRMNDIVTSLLTFNRLSATEKVTKEKVNLSELVDTEVNKYLSFAKAKGAEIIAVDTAEGLYVNCNGELMALAVDNYLSNAVKYTTGEKKITVFLSKTKKGFKLEVFNTAEPIDENEIKGLWDVLERQDSSRTRKENSTGMGLPICKRIFDIHGFKYECRNVNNGVIFSITGET